MGHYAIVIVDPGKHHAAALSRQVAHEAKQHARRKSGPLSAPQQRHMHREAARITGAPRRVGDLHTTADDECPHVGLERDLLAEMRASGLYSTQVLADQETAVTDAARRYPNCRNCGDQAFVALCRAAGHCPDCGTTHGIAPDSVLAATGVILTPLASRPQAGHRWNTGTRAFETEPVAERGVSGGDGPLSADEQAILARLAMRKAVHG